MIFQNLNRKSNSREKACSLEDGACNDEVRLYIIKKLIFPPPPIFLPKWYFSLKVQWKFPLFLRFSTSSPLYSRFFLKNHHIFPKINQQFKNWYFSSHYFFQNDIFPPKYNENFPFTPVSPPLPPYIRVFSK